MTLFTVIELFFFFQMHPDLSAHLHTDECNVIIKAYKSCQDQVCCLESQFYLIIQVIPPIPSSMFKFYIPVKFDTMKNL